MARVDDAAETLPGSRRYSKSPLALGLYTEAYNRGAAVLLNPAVPLRGTPEDAVVEYATSVTEDGLDSVAGEKFVFAAHLMAIKVDAAVRQVIEERGWSRSPFREGVYHNLAWQFYSPESEAAQNLRLAKEWDIDPSKFITRDSRVGSNSRGFSFPLCTTTLTDILKKERPDKDEVSKYYETMAALSMDFAHKLEFLSPEQGLEEVNRRMKWPDNIIFISHPELPFNLLLQGSNTRGDRAEKIRLFSYAGVSYDTSKAT